MKILLLGANGQVGWQLRRSLALLGEVATPRIDLREPQALEDAVLSLRPQAVVNAAAYTAVDRAEDEAEAAFAINTKSCEVLASATRDLGAWLVHYSSDYVYDGSGEKPWVETDATGPLSVYGKSKLAGDLAVAANPRHLILRTSWVYDSWGQNFIKAILKAAGTREELTVVADQWGAPTRAALIADVTALALRIAMNDESVAGTYHLAPTGFTNWHAYATLLVEEGIARGLPLRVTPAKIKPIPASQYPVKAPRPANSRLDTTKLRTTFGIALPAWEDGVRAVVAELADQSKFLRT